MFWGSANRLVGQIQSMTHFCWVNELKMIFIFYRAVKKKKGRQEYSIETILFTILK